MSEQLQGTATSQRAPFPFVVGCGRSGTTLVRAMLDSHPELAVPAETKFIVTMAKMRRRYESADGVRKAAFIADVYRYTDLGGRWGIRVSEASAFLEARQPPDYADAVRALFTLMAMHAGKPRYGNKTPKHVLSMPVIATLFPEAVFIHVIRDGRDVALSFLEKDFGPNTITQAAQEWKRLVTRGRRDGRRLGSRRYREIRYEELIADPERVLRSVCDISQLAFDATMLEYYVRAEEVRSGIRDPQHFGGLSLPPTPNMRNWRSEMDAADLAAFEAIAGETLDELDYPRASRGHRGAIAAAHARVLAEEGRRVATAVARRTRRARRASTHMRLWRRRGDTR